MNCASLDYRTNVPSNFGMEYNIFLFQDPRRGELYWRAKENNEQLNRYRDLRRNKKQLLNSTQLYKDWMYQVNYVRTY